MLLSCLSEFLSLRKIDLPQLYWIPELPMNTFKQRYSAGSDKCSTKLLSQILTRIFTAVKEGLVCIVRYNVLEATIFILIKHRIRKKRRQSHHEDMPI